MQTDALKRLVPTAVKRAIKESFRNAVLRRAVADLMRLGAGALPDRVALEKVRAAWGNESFGARLTYLERMVRLVAAESRPILECGSGVSTVVLGAVAGSRGNELWSLENMQFWHDQLGRILTRHNVPGVHLLSSPLKDYGGYSWYDLQPSSLPEEFGLVICDGPPGHTPGGRYGLLPVLGDRIPAGATILFDDAGREGEKAVLRRWHDEYGVEVVGTYPQEDGEFAILRR